jgi:hypothetical protein
MIQLEPIGKDIWIVDGGEIRFMGLRLGTRSTIIRLTDGTVWVHSPVRFSHALAEQIDGIGSVQYLIAPNLYHHLFIKQWQEHYPHAQVIGPHGLAEKRPDIEFTDVLGDPDSDPWRTDIERVIFTGSRAFDEHVFFHRASSTAILTDLIVNLRPEKQSRFGRLIARIEGVAYPNGRTPLLYRLGMRQRSEGAHAVRAILAWEPRQAVISHGEWFRDGATEELRRRFNWLPI